MYKLLSIILLLVFVVPNEKKERYLSDRITAYKDIEDIQGAFRASNPAFLKLGDSVFTKKNARDLVISGADSVHVFSFDRDSSGHSNVGQLFDHCIPGNYPTRFQDPFSYCIFTNLIEKVAAIGQALTGKKEPPKYGTMFVGELNAEKMNFKGTYLLMINARIAAFSHQMCKVALQPIRVERDINDTNFITFGLQHRKIDSIIVADRELNINFLYTMLEFHYQNMPPNNKLFLTDDYFEKALAYWNDGFEYFLLGHEYAHQLMAHENSTSPDTAIRNLDAWYKEVAADSLGQLILNRIVLSNADDQYQLGWNKYLLMGGNFLLATLGVYEKSLSIIEDDQEIKPLTDEERQTITRVFDWSVPYQGRLEKFRSLPRDIIIKDHPPAEIRMQQLARVTKQVFAKSLHSRNDFNDVEDLHYLLAQSLLYSVEKMYESDRFAIFNAYKQREQLEQFK